MKIEPRGGADHCLQVAWSAGTDAIARHSNFIFSPLSLRAVLALLAAGTSGETPRQLLAFLGSHSFPERPPTPSMSFVADHPFLFAIVEYEKAEILFLGHVVDPTKES